MPRPKSSGGGTPSNVLRELSQYRAQLMAQRAGLDEKLASIDRILGGGAPRTPAAAPAAAKRGRGGRRGRRGPRAGSLKEYILNVLDQAGKPMRVTDIASAVVDAGYKSKNKTLAKSVGIALAQLKVKKYGRGLYGR